MSSNKCLSISLPDEFRHLPPKMKEAPAVATRRGSLRNKSGEIPKVIDNYLKNTMYQSLKDVFNRILPISHEDWAAFESIVEKVELKKKDYLLREGQVCRGIYFLSAGAVRTFHLNERREINTSFNFQNDFLREIESMTSNKPSRKNIQAMEDSVVFYISKAKLMELYETSDFYQKLGRMILERLTISEQQYSSLLITYSPKERYLYVLENRPELVERVPLQHLASYLGISRESLSRIRKRV